MTHALYSKSHEAIRKLCVRSRPKCKLFFNEPLVWYTHKKFLISLWHEISVCSSHKAILYSFRRLGILCVSLLCRLLWFLSIFVAISLFGKEHYYSIVSYKTNKQMNMKWVNAVHFFLNFHFKRRRGENVVVVLLSMQGQKAPRFHIQISKFVSQRWTKDLRVWNDMRVMTWE